MYPRQNVARHFGYNIFCWHPLDAQIVNQKICIHNLNTQNPKTTNS